MSKKDQIKILKVEFDKITLPQATEISIKWAKGEKKRYIVTPNPEIVLLAQKNRKFLKVLNHADLKIADGTGILWASKYLHNTAKTKSKFIKIVKWLSSILTIPFSNKKILPERVTGTDLMQNICEKAAKNDLKIFLLGAGDGIAEIVRKKLENQHSGLKIVEAFPGSPKPGEEKKIQQKIESSEADILFVAYGAPKQEIWIARNLNKLKTIKLAIGVGGAFDFIAKVKKRAPHWMQKIGLEWLFRLIQQPSRIARIYQATIKFPIKILKYRLKN